MHISNNLGNKINFTLYSFKEEMVSDAIEKMLEAVCKRKYDTSMSNPFAYFTQIAWNCFSGDALVTTKEYGIVPISTLENKKVHVIDGNGDWVLSECKCHGEDEVFKIKISSAGSGEPITYKATANHDWYLHRNLKRKTSELKNGDSLLKLSKLPRKIEINNENDYKKGIIHGIVYGDGHANYKKRKSTSEKIFNGFAIRLCDKSVSLKKFFDEFNYPCSYPKSYKGEPIYYISNPVMDLKSLPTEDYITDDYMIGFIRGWIAADGNVSKQSVVSIISNIEGRDWLLKYGPKYGFFPTSNYILNRTTFSAIGVDTFNTKIDRRTLISDDFLLDYKKENFNSNIKSNYSRGGKIIDVSYSGIEKIYCFNVPTTHSFVLIRGIITGNSFLQRIEKEKRETYIKHKNFEKQFFNELEDMEDEYKGDVLGNEYHNKILDEFENPKKSKGYAIHKNLSYSKNRKNKNDTSVQYPSFGTHQESEVLDRLSKEKELTSTPV